MEKAAKSLLGANLQAATFRLLLVWAVLSALAATVFWI